VSSQRDKPEDEPSGLRPIWMLQNAEQLARRAGDTAGPRTVHARRSVSAAYYAVFHCLCIKVAWTAVPMGSDDTRYVLCRVFDHGPIDTIAKWVAQQATPPDAMDGLLRSLAELAELRMFARRFVQLKDWRTIADYDHLRSVGRPMAVAACKSARRALDALDEVYGAPEWMTFTTLVLLRGSRAAR